MPRIRLASLFLAPFYMIGCASDPAASPPEVERLYFPIEARAGQSRCGAIQAELAALDATLGGPAEEAPPPVPAGAGARWGAYGKNVVVQTVIGPLQPIIQTVRAASNSDEKARLATQTEQRAEIRRAYLIGSRDGAGCL